MVTLYLQIFFLHFRLKKKELHRKMYLENIETIRSDTQPMMVCIEKKNEKKKNNNNQGAVILFTMKNCFIQFLKITYNYTIFSSINFLHDTADEYYTWQHCKARKKEMYQYQQGK